MWQFLSNPRNKPADSSDISRRGTITQLSLCQAQACSSQVAKRPIQALVASEQNFVSQPNVQ